LQRKRKKKHRENGEQSPFFLQLNLVGNFFMFTFEIINQ